jgi:hypothetical protein
MYLTVVEVFLPLEAVNIPRKLAFFSAPIQLLAATEIPFDQGFSSATSVFSPMNKLVA